MSAPTLNSVAEFAKRAGVTRVTAHRWAQAGKLGPITMRPGAKVKGRRLDVAELVARGLLVEQPIDLDRWKVVAKDVLEVIGEHARQTFKDRPEDFAKFVELWCQMFGAFPRGMAR